MTSSIWVEFAGQSSANAGHVPKVKTTASPARPHLEIIALFSSITLVRAQSWCAPSRKSSSRLAREALFHAFSLAFGP
jgi:hypothetical protein